MVMEVNGWRRSGSGKLGPPGVESSCVCFMDDKHQGVWSTGRRVLKD